METLDPELGDFWETKYRGPVLHQGEKVGTLSESWARKLGLTPETVVAAANIDAHVSAPAAGMTAPGEMLLILGTSTCAVICGTRDVAVRGGSGVVRDGVLPGYFGHEAGQSCTGDLLNWFVRTGIPGEMHGKEEIWDETCHRRLTAEASRLKAGESGLVALDWWNGTRSVLQDAELTGLIAGLSLKTTSAEIYRALIESTAYGARVILEAFEEAGVPVNKIICTGGMASKNTLLLQIYADVLKRVLEVPETVHSGAMGSAMYAAVAAGEYDSILTEAKRMKDPHVRVIRPDPEAEKIYDILYREYRQLYDLYGRSGSLLHRLKRTAAGDK